ncbi:MAG: VTT domain-containing protein [bacterium]|nr:VTT domain-containing protein [bacterium]
MKLSKYIPYLLTALVFFILYLIGSKFSEEEINVYLDNVGPWGPVVILLLLIVVNIVAPLSNSPIVFAGFYAYGRWIIPLTLLAGLITSITNFYIGRYLGRSIVVRLIGEKNVEKADKFIQGNGLFMLFFLRVFQGGYFDYISYVIGLTSLKFKPYIIVTILGLIPGYLIWYLVSLKTDTALEFTAVSVTLSTALSIIFFIGFFLVEFIKRKTKVAH